MAKNKNFWRWVIPDDFKSTRADKDLLPFLQIERPGLSRTQLTAWIEQKLVLQDGVPLIRVNTRLTAGSTIEVRFPDPEPMDLVPEERDIEILFEDEHLLIVNKPQGLTVHPSSTQKTGTLVHALLFQIKNLSGIGGVLRPGIVHRLDKDTSGALVISKTDIAHQRLAEIFSKHDIQRKYIAFVYGRTHFKPTPFKLETKIGRNPKNRLKMTCDIIKGRTAISYFKSIEHFENYASLVEITLETGRTHQIRVHLTSLKHSVLGDPLYGKPTARDQKWLQLPQNVRDIISELPGQALHAKTIGFVHPMTQETIHVEAPPPPIFQKLHTTLKRGQ